MVINTRFEINDVIFYYFKTNNKTTLTSDKIRDIEYKNGTVYYITENGYRVWESYCFVSLEEYKNSVLNHVKAKLKTIKNTDKNIIDLDFDDVFKMYNSFELILD